MPRTSGSITERIVDAIRELRTAHVSEVAERAGLEQKKAEIALANIAAGRYKWVKDVRRVERGVYTVEPAPEAEPDLDQLTIIARDPSGTAVAQDVEGKLWLVRPLTEETQ